MFTLLTLGFRPHIMLFRHKKESHFCQTRLYTLHPYFGQKAIQIKNHFLYRKICEFIYGVTLRPSNLQQGLNAKTLEHEFPEITTNQGPILPT